MLAGIYEKLQSASGVAMVIISVALMLFCGFAATRITKRLRLPNVTAYILPLPLSRSRPENFSASMY